MITINPNVLSNDAGQILTNAINLEKKPPLIETPLNNLSSCIVTGSCEV